ncbi:MAG: tRNA pseudouridine(38-40) synthase TruA [Planctomycetaceae bacterium]
MQVIRLTIAYDGTAFAGWQVQPDRPTVQSVLQAALADLTGEPTSVLAASRTDAGVHALGQVASFRTNATIPPDRWPDALRSRLPHDIVVLESRSAPPEFHPTYDARRKRYRYLIRRTRYDDPFVSRYAWRIEQPLDIEAMRAALPALLGTHDFRCFESHWPNKATSVRTMFDARLDELPRWTGWSAGAISRRASGTAPDAPSRSPILPAEFLAFEIAGDGFLYNMVRSIVGTLVKIGLSDWPPDRLAEIITRQDRAQAGPTAPPHGLYLVRVEYDE